MIMQFDTAGDKILLIPALHNSVSAGKPVEAGMVHSVRPSR